MPYTLTTSYATLIQRHHRFERLVRFKRFHEDFPTQGYEYRAPTQVGWCLAIPNVDTPLSVLREKGMLKVFTAIPSDVEYTRDMVESHSVTLDGTVLNRKDYTMEDYQEPMITAFTLTRPCEAEAPVEASNEAPANDAEMNEDGEDLDDGEDAVWQYAIYHPCTPQGVKVTPWSQLAPCEWTVPTLLTYVDLTTSALFLELTCNHLSALPSTGACPLFFAECHAWINGVAVDSPADASVPIIYCQQAQKLTAWVPLAHVLPAFHPCTVVPPGTAVTLRFHPSPTNALVPTEGTPSLDFCIKEMTLWLHRAHDAPPE
jgi:hypothetical protein